VARHPLHDNFTLLLHLQHLWDFVCCCLSCAVYLCVSGSVCERSFYCFQTKCSNGNSAFSFFAQWVCVWVADRFRLNCRTCYWGLFRRPLLTYVPTKKGFEPAKTMQMIRIIAVGVWLTRTYWPINTISVCRNKSFHFALLNVFIPPDWLLFMGSF